MNSKVARILCAALLLVFVNFMFSNALFIHSHHLAGGRTVTHSHPYLPSSHHTHTSQSIDLISAFNCAASAADAAASPTLSAPHQCVVVMEPPRELSLTCAVTPTARLRGPPQG
ncbi:hypothetical protein ED551_05655 [Muribaculaceae bacterium Isolate-013 (NCI)]|nr:hypothetical protein ED551_05655 [Muribaculaceae bacterium Isolate-013 (NCI)]